MGLTSFISLFEPVAPLPGDGDGISAEPINNPAVNTSFGNSEEFLEDYVPRIIGIIFIIGVIVFFFMLLIGAVQWIASGGEKMAVEAARKRISHAIIGLVILFAVFAVAGLLGGFLGVDLLHINTSWLEL
jgi:hypothetical protein